jgi:hypothetical protein
MNTPTARTSLGRGRVIVLACLIVASSLTALPSGLLAQEPSTSPESLASLEPAVAACESADDLRLIADFLRDTDTSEDGWLPVFVGAVAGLSEARQLAGLLGDTYRPLVDNLIASLEGLRTTVEQLDGQETVGAQLAVIGEAITDIGNAMDALSVELQTPCPVDA